jgi:hypothetical protein
MKPSGTESGTELSGRMLGVEVGPDLLHGDPETARPAKPWFREARDAWYVNVQGKRVKLVDGESNRDEAYRRILALNPGETKAVIAPVTGQEVCSLLCSEYALVTPRDAEIYPLDALAEFHGARWQVELGLCGLETTMKMDVLKCKTVDGVPRELTVYANVYNSARVVMLETAGRQRADVEWISFVDALRWLARAKSGDELPEFVVNPDRPGLYVPRGEKTTTQAVRSHEQTAIRCTQ